MLDVCSDTSFSRFGENSQIYVSLKTNFDISIASFTNSIFDYSYILRYLEFNKDGSIKNFSYDFSSDLDNFNFITVFYWREN